MPDALYTILSIIIFILSLSFIVAIHELGHLAMAKVFKVYAYEYAIGFGPKLFKKKRKDGETHFSIRAIPLGGFVSMFDEPEDAIELLGYEVPKERTVSGIKHWKQISIFLAGIVLNFALAYVLFAVNNIAFVQNDFYGAAGVGIVAEGSPADLAGIVSLDGLNRNVYAEQNAKAGLSSTSAILDNDATFTYPDAENPGSYITINGVFVVFDSKGLNRFSESSFSDYFNYYHANPEDLTVPNVSDEGRISIVANSTIEFKLTTFQSNFHNVDEVSRWEPFFVGVKNADGKVVALERHSTVTLKSILSAEQYKFEDMGFTAFLHSFRFNFGEALYASGDDWSRSFTLIFETIGRLFTSIEAWGQVGGPIAIFAQTDQLLRTGDVGLLFFFWGMISVNVGIMNLLPIPALDGSQALFALVEMVIRRPVNKKVKRAIMMVGTILVFALMAVILFKDVFTSCSMITALIL